MQQKNNNDDGYGDQFFNQCAFYRFNRFFNQCAAVVGSFKCYAFGQAFLHLVHFLFYGGNYFIRIFIVAHYYNAPYYFALSIRIKNAKAQITPHLHGANILNPYRYAIVIIKSNILHILLAFDIAEATDDIGHVGHLKFSAAYIIVVGFYFVHHIHQGDIVVLQFNRVNHQLVLLFKAAK